MVKTWFVCGTMICSDPSQVEAVFTTEIIAQHKAVTLTSAEVITFACAGPLEPESPASGIVQVEVIMHSSSSTAIQQQFQIITLEIWLDPARNP